MAAQSATNLYVADTENCAIRQVGLTATGWQVSTLAGRASWWGGLAGYKDAMGTNALFGWPSGVAVDNAGCVYVADTCNDAIRKVTPGGMVTTLGGVGSVWTYDDYGLPQSYQLTYGNVDGQATDAEFYYPNSLTIDGGANIYVSDCYDQTIRKGHK